MLHIKNINDDMASFDVLKSNLSLYLDVEYTENVQQDFRRENNKGLLFTISWSGQLLFLFFVHAPHGRCCLRNEGTPTEEEPPLATGFYNLRFTI